MPYWQVMVGGQHCALIDFAWNLGQDFYGDEPNFATISRDLLEHQWESVPTDLLLYCNPGTSVESGLRRRRQAEADLWRESMAQTPSAPVAQARWSHPNPLPVPWFDKLKMDDGQGWRDCFTASSAMLAAYWGKEADENSYDSLRERFGDTTSSEAQLQALRSLGLDAQFGSDGTFDMLRREIDAGVPWRWAGCNMGQQAPPAGAGTGPW